VRGVLVELSGGGLRLRGDAGTGPEVELGLKGDVVLVDRAKLGDASVFGVGHALRGLRRRKGKLVLASRRGGGGGALVFELVNEGQSFLVEVVVFHGAEGGGEALAKCDGVDVER
jgi:hypothetical protein